MIAGLIKKTVFLVLDEFVIMLKHIQGIIFLHGSGIAWANNHPPINDNPTYVTDNHYTE
jgi:hypothetical protein